MTEMQPQRRAEAPEYVDHTLLGRDDVEFEISAQLIGFSTSQRDEHNHPLGTDTDPVFAEAGTRCSACRWFEIRIFLVGHEYTEDCTCDAVDPEDGDHAENCGVEPARARYLVLTYGRSLVPGETNKRRAEWTDSPYEVIEVLTQRNNAATRGRYVSNVFIPAASARALAQAANFDHGIQTAYVNRAVA